MKRREYAKLSAAVASGLPGCSARSASGPARPRLDEVPCPVLRTRARGEFDRSVCSGDGGDVHLVAGDRFVRAGRDPPVEFELHNGGDGSIAFDPTAWRVLRWADGRWEEYFVPEMFQLVGKSLGPNGTYSWLLHVAEWTRIVDQKRELALHLESPGIYAFEVAATDESGTRAVYAARFEYAE